MCEFSRPALFLHPPCHKSKSPWLFALHLRSEGLYCTLAFREMHSFFVFYSIPEIFIFTQNQTLNGFSFGTILKVARAVRMANFVLSGSLKVNVSNPDLCTRVKISDMWTKQGALLASPLQGKLCEMQFLLVKTREKESRAWEGRVAPLRREGLSPEEAILVTSACPPPHSSLTNVKKR